MVAIAAFLIICVIIFGLENVRSFIFGSFGIIAWIVLGIFGLAAILSLGEWIHNERMSDKKRKSEAKAKNNARLAELKAKDLKAYKKERRFTVFGIVSLISFIVVFAALIVALIVTSR
jgi:ABC-type antimicrobial peptide transport system permease subunit